jgi:uncharacterized cupin superfamily protein
VDESVVRLAVIRGEYHWHHHENEDDFFHVVTGKLLMVEKASIYSKES